MCGTVPPVFIQNISTKKHNPAPLTGARPGGGDFLAWSWEDFCLSTRTWANSEWEKFDFFMGAMSPPKTEWEDMGVIKREISPTCAVPSKCLTTRPVPDPSFRPQFLTPVSDPSF